jgi:ATP-dependent DNA helicase PIF1
MFLDVASMCSAKVLEIIDRGLQDLRNSTLPFGGMFLILGGDFRQILPVVRHGTRGELIQQCIKSSYLWNQFHVIRLSQNMRANQDESHFAAWLLEVGNGSADDLQHNVTILSECLLRGNLAEEVFGNSVLASEMSTLRTKIINELNRQIIQTLPGEITVVKSIDQIICEPGVDPTEYPVEFLNTLLTSGLPPHELYLKIGAIVMLLRNLDIKSGLRKVENHAHFRQYN